VIVAESTQKLREAMDKDGVQDWASMVCAVREVKKIMLRCPELVAGSGSQVEVVLVCQQCT